MSAVSLVATVKDEAETVHAFLDSLLAQTRKPDEVLIVDGGSTDDTAEIVAEVARNGAPVRLHLAPGSTISQGRNAAIEMAANPLVAVTDAGTVARPDWLEKLIEPLEGDPSLDVSAGFYAPGGEIWFERALSAITLQHLDEVDPGHFLPSSRSMAFRKEWWRRVGGYPDWLRHCEDLVFDLDLRRAGAAFAFVPDATVAWRARASLPSFFKQYFNYARGDGHASLWPKRHAIRYSAYCSGLLLARAARRAPGARVLLGIGVGVYFGKFYRRVWRHIGPRDPALLASVAVLIPLVVTVGDLAKMLGYPLGRYERLRYGRSGLRRRLAATPRGPLSRE
jgi:glycosyltransferase involved in cell wall biosynthesis